MLTKVQSHINMFDWIETEDEYYIALKRFLEISVHPEDTKEVREMYLLMDLMGKYERKNCGDN